MQERLQKIIARAGIASRRHAEQLIRAGAVSVNGKVVTELGTKADLERDHIRVGGKLLRFSSSNAYLILHKPANCVATMHDPEGRRALCDFLHGVPGRVFPVGRLDYHASGLVLLTSDGALAQRLLKAADRLPQTYWFKLKGALSNDERLGVERKTGARIRALARGANPWYEVTLTGARRDLVRRAFEQAGHPVEKTKRVKLAGLELASLPAGRYRFLELAEVKALERLAGRCGEGLRRVV